MCKLFLSIFPADCSNALYLHGQVPRLVDGEVAVLQSLAILRHVGRKHGLYGKSDADAARIDSLLDGLEDMRNKTRALVCEWAL